MILNSTFQENEIEQEKKVVIEEIHSANDVPEELVQDTFVDALLNPLPESKPILGTDESVTSLSRDDLIAYISKYHDARNMIIAVAGNFNHEDVVGSLEKKMLMNRVGEFASFKNKSIKYQPFHQMKREISQTHLCVGVKTKGYSDKRHMSLWLLNTVLGYGMSSRLFQIIREKHGLAYSIYSFTELLSSVGVIATYAATDTVNCDRVLKLIHEEYERLSDELIDETTFNDAKNQMKGNLILSLESSYSRMCRLAKQEIYFGNYREVSDTISEIEAITPEEIMNTAHELFLKQRPFTVLVTP
jgi:predicted Zn-dependent peptidase